MESEKLIEVITYSDGDKVATLLTDGTSTKTIEPEYCKEHSSIVQAKRYLEALGYNIEEPEDINFI